MEEYRQHVHRLQMASIKVRVLQTFTRSAGMLLSTFSKFCKLRKLTFQSIRFTIFFYLESLILY